jgi:hypothetical protein
MQQHEALAGPDVGGSLELAACPECGRAAEVEPRGAARSTGGPVDLVFVRCISRHWFLMPAADLSIG